MTIYFNVYYVALALESSKNEINFASMGFAFQFCIDEIVTDLKSVTSI